MKKAKTRALFVAAFILITIVSTGFYGGVLKAEFKPPKDITNYIPSGFTIDEQHSGTKDYGMYVATNVLGSKED